MAGFKAEFSLLQQARAHKHTHTHTRARAHTNTNLCGEKGWGP